MNIYKPLDILSCYFQLLGYAVYLSFSQFSFLLTFTKVLWPTLHHKRGGTFGLYKIEVGVYLVIYDRFKTFSFSILERAIP